MVKKDAKGRERRVYFVELRTQYARTRAMLSENRGSLRVGVPAIHSLNIVVREDNICRHRARARRRFEGCQLK